jgi:hypothetical protein
MLLIVFYRYKLGVSLFECCIFIVILNIVLRIVIFFIVILNFAMLSVVHYTLGVIMLSFVAPQKVTLLLEFQKQ